MRKNGFWGASALLAGSTAFAQGLAFAASAVNARIYSPEEIGVYTLVIAAESLFGSVLSLRYEAMVVTSREKRAALVYVKASLFMSCVLSLVYAAGYGAVTFAGQGIGALFVLPVAVILLLRGALNVLEAMSNRDKAYGVISSAQVLRVAVQSAVGIALGLLGFGAWGLVMAHALGTACGLLRQRRVLAQYKNELRAVTIADMRAALQSAYRQPLYATPAIFANRLSYNAITVTVGTAFGSAAAGFYGMANKALSLPLDIFSRSIGKVFFREASMEYAETGRFVKAFRKASLTQCGISVVVGIAGYALAPWAFSVVYGEKWRYCGEIVRTLLPMLCVRMVTSSVAQGFQVAGKQRLELVLYVLTAAAVIGCGLVCAAAETGMDVYLRAIAVVMAVSYAVIYGAVAWCANRKHSE